MAEARRRWTYTVYHDEPGEAATDSATKGWPYVTEQDAIEAAFAAIERDSYWNGGATVEIGDWHPAQHPDHPAYWDERETVAVLFDGVVNR